MLSEMTWDSWPVLVMLILSILTFCLTTWIFLQDCDVLLKFYTIFGASEDKALGGKVAWITGAGSGIGRELALRWGARSAKLVLNDLNSAPLEDLKRTLVGKIGVPDKNILLLPGDIADASNHELWMQEILKTFGRLDILANNAGRGLQGQVRDVPFHEEKALFDINMFAHVSLAKLVLPHLLHRKTGHIVQVSSRYAVFETPSTAAYNASKAAVKSYFTTLRSEVWKDNVSVTVVLPGPVQTNILAGARKVGPQPLVDTVKFPKICNAMAPRRCAELISVATVNKLGEAWVISQPMMTLTRLYTWVPTLAIWFMAGVVWPLVSKHVFDEPENREVKHSGLAGVAARILRSILGVFVRLATRRGRGRGSSGTAKANADSVQNA